MNKFVYFDFFFIKYEKLANQMYKLSLLWQNHSYFDKIIFKINLKFK